MIQDSSPLCLVTGGFAHQHLSLPKVLPAVSLALLAKLTPALLRFRFFKSIYLNGRTYSHLQYCVKYYTSAQAERLSPCFQPMASLRSSRADWTPISSLPPYSFLHIPSFHTVLVCCHFPFGSAIFFKTQNIDVV